MSRVFVIDESTPRLFELEVTPETAAYWLKNYNYDEQRETRDRHVARLARALEKGEFEENLVSFRVFQGRPYMVNAYHTLNAIVSSGVSQTLPVRCIPVGSWRDVENGYQRTDRGLGRSYSDACPLQRIAAEHGLSKASANCIQQAAPYILSGFSHSAYFRELNGCVSTDDRTAFLEEWADFGREYFEAVSLAHPLLFYPLRRAAVVAVGLVNFRHCPAGNGAVSVRSPELAGEFWSKIAANNRLEVGTPEHTLCELLKDKTRYRVGFSGAIEFAALTAKCWNAYWDGYELSCVFMKKKKQGDYNPVEIRGSKYVITLPKRREREKGINE